MVEIDMSQGTNLTVSGDVIDLGKEWKLTECFSAGDEG